MVFKTPGIRKQSTVSLRDRKQTRQALKESYPTVFLGFQTAAEKRGGDEGGAWKALGLEETELRNQGNQDN